MCEELVGTKVGYDTKLRASNKRPSMFLSVGRKYSVSKGLEDTRFVEKVLNPTTPPIHEFNSPDDESELRPLK